MGDPLSASLGAVGATMHAFNLVKAFSDIRDATKVQALKFELQGLLLEAQQAQSSLIDEKRHLEERVRQLEAWDGEKQRYQLHDAGNGCMVYRLKPDADPPEPPHDLCANCYNRGRKQVLTPFHIVTGRADALQCSECKTEIVIRGNDAREANRIAAKVMRPSGRGSLGPL